MKKKIFSLILCGVLLLGITGCAKNKVKEEKEVLESKLTAEEKLWLDAADDRIYKQRIYLLDEYSKFHDKESVFSFDSDLKALSEVKDNTFAQKFIELYNKTNLKDIMSGDSYIKKYVLYCYLSLATNRCEGTCAHNDRVDIYIPKDGTNLTKVYYRDKSFDSDLNPISNYNFAWVPFIFEYTTNDSSDKNYFLINYFDNKEEEENTYHILTRTNSLEEAQEYAHKKWVEIYKKDAQSKHEYSWIELDNSIIDEVINNNKEFLNFYIKYKKELYYPRYDKEHPETNNSSTSGEKSSPSIGMTAEEVRKSSWGSPDKINKDTYSWGTTEQWVYNKKGYIYFKNGIVSSISER